MLSIYREVGFSDKNRAFQILVDGINIGKIKQGETFTLLGNDCEQHTLQLKVDWCTSVAMSFNGSKEANFSCNTCIQKKAQIFFSIFYTFFRANAYINLIRCDMK